MTQNTGEWSERDLAYSSYYALRKLHTDLILDAISSEDFEHVIEELLSLITLFGADTSRGIAF